MIMFITIPIFSHLFSFSFSTILVIIFKQYYDVFVAFHMRLLYRRLYFRSFLDI